MFLTFDKLELPPSPFSDVVLQNRVTQLERELREKKHEMQQKMWEVREEREMVTRLQSEMKKERETVMRLQGEVNEERETVRKLQGEMNEERQTVMRLQVEGQEKRERVLRLQGEVRRERETVMKLQEEGKEARETVVRLQGEVREEREAVVRLQGEVREEREAVVRLQGEVREEKETVVRVQEELREEREAVMRLQEEVREERETVVRLMEEVREERETVMRLQGETRMKGETVTRLEGSVTLLQNSLSRQRECHVTELRQLGEESEQYQRQLREEQIQRQQLSARIDTAMGHLRGEAVIPQALQLWELPRDDVHISPTILGTGGWGYVARGTFRGQVVAVKCLHRAILSPQNEGRVRREISIMAQVRHPNLLLLIGAVLTTEGVGPLIVTESLDRSLRSAYENGVLEERSKVPVLRDVSSALTYLHSHRTPIIHRDVSSANVLLQAVRGECDWLAKLSDFGSANLSHLATTPQEGAAVYSAPEVSTEDRSRQTAKIDVYSFGVLVCEVCLCRFPPNRHEFPSMLDDVCRTSPDLSQLSRDCTSHTSQDRPSMREILERLTQFL